MSTYFFFIYYDQSTFFQNKIVLAELNFVCQYKIKHKFKLFFTKIKIFKNLIFKLKSKKGSNLLQKTNGPIGNLYKKRLKYHHFKFSQIIFIYFVFLIKVIAESIAGAISSVLISVCKIIMVHIFVSACTERSVYSTWNSNSEPLILINFTLELLFENAIQTSVFWNLNI